MRLRNLYKKENYKPEIRPMINTFQDQLYLLESKQAKGAKNRANIRWGLEGEKCSKTFFQVLERQNMVSESATEELLNKIPPNRKISKEHFKLCEAEIYLDEIIKAINSQKNNKSPGNDGLTAEFYKQLLNELAPILLEVYNSWNRFGIIGASSRTGIISVIYKKGDKKDIANYRPISLLNLDYKIYTTILKNRMQQTLNNIIGENQTAAIKNRTILHTLSTIRDIIDISNKLNKNLSVISLDFLKAFDRLDLNFIFLVLRQFGYGQKFIQMIKVCYNDIQSKIKVNGLLSAPFTIMRSVRQGCPLSVLLYIIVAEVLAIFIIADTIVKRVQIGTHEIKIINFADDTTIFLRDIECLTRIQAILNLYEKASSSKINLSKSQALWAGTYKNRYDKPGKMACFLHQNIRNNFR